VSTEHHIVGNQGSDVLVGDAAAKIITALGGNDVLRGDAVWRARTGRAGHALPQADNLDQKRPGGDARSTGDAAIAARSHFALAGTPSVLFPGDDDVLIANSEPSVISANLGPAFSPAPRATLPTIRQFQTLLFPAISKNAPCSFPCKYQKCSLLL
jgi:Ca2+-binding RTX toxin-like protein